MTENQFICFVASITFVIGYFTGVFVALIATHLLPTNIEED